MGWLDYSILTILGLMLLTLFYQLFFAKQKQKPLIFVLSVLLLFFAWINFKSLILPQKTVIPPSDTILIESGSKQWEEEMKIHEKGRLEEMKNLSKDDPRYKALEQDLIRLKQSRQRVELEKNSSISRKEDK